jgi:Cu/Ag efflux pump CusA
MELTGIKTAVGIKIQGPDLAHIEDIGARMQQILSTVPETNSVFAERVSQGFYLNVDVNRPCAKFSIHANRPTRSLSRPRNFRFAGLTATI